MGVTSESAARHLHPRVRVVWWIGSVVSDLVMIAVLTGVAVLVSVNTDLEPPRWLVLVPVVLVLVAIAARTAYTAAAYRAWTYRFTSDGLEIEYGVWWKQASAMPYHRLQQVDVTQGPLERRFGMSSVRLRSAAATTDATIPGMADDEIDELRSRLMQGAGRDDGA